MSDKTFSDELLERLDNIVPIIAEKLGVATDKALELCSETIDQALSYNLIYASLTAVLLGLGMAAILGVIVVSVRCVCKNNDEMFPFAFIACLFGCFAGVAMCVGLWSQINTILKISYAPNLYILELAKSAIR